VPDKVTISHRGERFEIGLGKRQYAVWAVNAPRDQPVDRWPETAEGWSQAWSRFTTIETPGTITAVPRARPFKIPGNLLPNAPFPLPAARLPVIASGLVILGIALGVAGLFPAYFTGQSLASATDQLVPHALYLATWAVAAALIMAPQFLAPRPRQGAPASLPRVGALLGTGLSAVTFGLLIADLGTGTASHAGVGAGMVLSLAGWVACAAGCAAALRTRAAATADGAGRKPGRKLGRAAAGPIALLSLCALGAAITFIPSWDSYTLAQASTGSSQTATAGNAFDNPGWVIFGDMAAVVALVIVAIAAATWRPARQGAALLAGAIVAMGAQAISALIQVSQPASPVIFGISAAQARANGLSVSSGLTSIFWVYGLFVIALAISCAWLLTAPAHAAARYPATLHPAGQGPLNYAESPAGGTGAAVQDQARDQRPPAAGPARDGELSQGDHGQGEHGQGGLSEDGLLDGRLLDGQLAPDKEDNGGTSQHGSAATI
jgi:hypothetical protein